MFASKRRPLGVVETQQLQWLQRVHTPQAETTGRRHEDGKKPTGRPKEGRKGSVGEAAEGRAEGALKGRMMLLRLDLCVCHTLYLRVFLGLFQQGGREDLQGSAQRSSLQDPRKRKLITSMHLQPERLTKL